MTRRLLLVPFAFVLSLAAMLGPQTIGGTPVVLALDFAFVLSLAASTALADAPMAMLTPGDIKWGDAPPVFPKGAKMAVLYGDPSKAGELFIVRLYLEVTADFAYAGTGISFFGAQTINVAAGLWFKF